MTEQLQRAARDPVARRITFVPSTRRVADDLPRDAKVLNPKFYSNQLQAFQRMKLSAPTKQATDENEEVNSKAKKDTGVSFDANTGHNAAEAEAAERARRAKLRPPNCDDDDPLFNDPPRVMVRYVPHLNWRSNAGCGRGLHNSANTCFMNSVLQCIAHSPALGQYLSGIRLAQQSLRRETVPKPDGSVDILHTTAFAIQQLIGSNAASTQRRRGVLNPIGIIQVLTKLFKKGQFRVGMQADSQEFLSQLLDHCQMALLHRHNQWKEEKVPPTVGHTTELMRCVGGYTISQVSWKVDQEISQLKKAGNMAAAKDLKIECNTKGVSKLHSNTYETFTSIQLAVTGSNTLQRCLQRFCTKEVMDGCIYNTPRKVGVDITKQFMFHSLPPTLIMSLKRFDNRGAKISRNIEIPEVLDMAPFSSESCRTVFGTNGKIEYRLTGMVVHAGRMLHYGHYYAYYRAPNGAWYLADDESVSSVSVQRALKEEAYVLFYSRIETAAPKQQRSSSAAPEKAAATPQAVDMGRQVTEDELQDHLAKSRRRSERQANSELPKTPAAESVKRRSERAPELSPVQMPVSAPSPLLRVRHIDDEGESIPPEDRQEDSSSPSLPPSTPLHPNQSDSSVEPEAGAAVSSIPAVYRNLMAASQKKRQREVVEQEAEEEDTEADEAAAEASAPAPEATPRLTGKERRRLAKLERRKQAMLEKRSASKAVPAADDEKGASPLLAAKKKAPITKTPAKPPVVEDDEDDEDEEIVGDEVEGIDILPQRRHRKEASAPRQAASRESSVDSSRDAKLAMAARKAASSKPAVSAIKDLSELTNGRLSAKVDDEIFDSATPAKKSEVASTKLSLSGKKKKAKQQFEMPSAEEMERRRQQVGEVHDFMAIRGADTAQLNRGQGDADAFHKSTRDPEWDAQLDQGRLKKVGRKGHEYYAEQLYQEGRNQFQDAAEKKARGEELEKTTRKKQQEYREEEREQRKQWHRERDRERTDEHFGSRGGGGFNNRGRGGGGFQNRERGGYNQGGRGGYGGGRDDRYGGRDGHHGGGRGRGGFQQRGGRGGGGHHHSPRRDQDGGRRSGQFNKFDFVQPKNRW